MNVDVDDATRERIIRQQKSWGPIKLVGLLAATMAVSLVVLYAMAQTTSQTTWSDWLIP